MPHLNVIIFFKTFLDNKMSILSNVEPLSIKAGGKILLVPKPYLDH